jgi:hypothetical protein
MPMINGCYFSKKALKNDTDFFKSQGLSEEQITAISMYLQQRMSAYLLYVASTFVIGVLAGFIGFLLAI